MKLSMVLTKKKALLLRDTTQYFNVVKDNLSCKILEFKFDIIGRQKKKIDVIRNKRKPMIALCL